VGGPEAPNSTKHRPDEEPEHNHMDQQDGATFDPHAARQWLDVLYPGDTPGLIHVSATGNWAGRAFTDRGQAIEYMHTMDSREGVYLRATTLRAQPAAGGRGSAADSLALPGLWADVDIAGPGHKTTEQLPPDEATAQQIITESGLPTPSLWVSSGGGLYPWWLLDQPIEVTTGNLADLEKLSQRWQNLIGRSAAALGWHYGTGVGDLARVLRVPGSVNRKAGLARPCRIIQDGDDAYTLDQLNDGLAAALERHPEPERQPSPPPQNLTNITNSGHHLAVVRAPGETTPNDDFEARTAWDDELLLHGWEITKGAPGSYCEWRRPGKDTEGISATTGFDPSRDRLKVFTDASAFTQGEVYTKPGAYAVLHHGGDHRAATRELARLGFGTQLPSPAEQQRAAFADLIPPGSPAARYLEAVDGTSARVLAEPAPKAAEYGPTQDGLARALVDHRGSELRYCPQRGRWLHWNGHRWLWDEAERHREMVRALARSLPDGEGWSRFKSSALSANGVTGVVRLAQSDPAIAVHIDQLDSQPYELNTPAGIIDLRTGALRSPDPTAMHTRSTSVAPDFDRRSEIFDRFLHDTFADAELIGYIQRLFGVSAIGKVLEQLLPFGHGSGANGKSTLLEAVMHVLGFGETGYAMAAPSEMLMIRKHNEHPAELAQLSGARLVVCSELESGQRFAEAKVKQLTGRDSINARFMRRDPFTFVPSHTLWLLGNHKPNTKAGGPAFWRRVRLLPFTRVVPEEQRDPKLGEKLVEDAPAILAWMAQGAADYEKNGMREPAVVKAATAAYKNDQDTVSRFIDERCFLSPGVDQVRVFRDDLRNAYEDWCREGGDEPVGAKDFVQEVRNRAHNEGVTRGRRWFSGISLLATDEEDGDRDQSWYR
jgi:putative DNA primase/helicase